MPISRSSERKQLQQGLNAIFGLEYQAHPDLWRDIFTESTSEKAYEEDVKQIGLGGAEVKNEGGAVSYDEMYETYTARYQHVTIAKAVAITEEAIEDNLYASVGSRIAKALARSVKHTKNLRRTNILNYGFDTNYPGGDGQPLFSLSHPLGGGGTFQNMLTTAADLSESALEEATIVMGNWVDDRGIPIMAQTKSLIIPVDLQYVAMRLLESPYQPDTNDNNINALRTAGSIPKVSVNRYVTDVDSWFLTTDVPDGLKAFQRVALKRGVEGDFETGNTRYKVRERYSEGWSDPMGAFGSPGA